uniref:RRM domain-containing protein n=1 Tax=Chlamydomonas leiostraca TaxID=1034604 RepID=A0A7S0WZT7_9CHLO
MSRCFVVCGKAITSEDLQAAFAPYGNIQQVKVIREKGVAYVRYDKASSAALAIESLNGATLNNGRGPKLKVLLAEAPSARTPSQHKMMPEAEVSTDPDNIPARSRLFIVVPKQADAQLIQDDFSKFADLEYCKTDLIASKGVVFCKFSKSSSALVALENISERGMQLAGYKVKAMLAEPKTKRGRSDGSPQDMMGYHMSQAAKLDYSQLGMDPIKLQMGAGLPGGHMNVDYLTSLANANFNAALAASNMNNLAAAAADMQALNSQGLGFVGGLGNLQTGSPVSPNNMAGAPVSKQRLFVVVHKGVTEDALARLFRRFHGMEYCDLKKDRTTGKSKGYCYVNYSTPEAAAAAVEQLNGVEFPPHTGHRIKVMFAEPLGMRGAPSSSMGTAPYSALSASTSHSHHGMNSINSMPGSALSTRSPGGMSVHASTAHASPARTPIARPTGSLATPDTVASVSESLANMSVSMPRVGSVTGGMGDDSVAAAAARLASPMAPGVAVARELMFNGMA